MGDDDDNGGSRPDTSAATMQAFLNGGTEDGVAEQIPPRNEQEAKEASENGGGADGGGGGLFVNQGMLRFVLYGLHVIPLLLRRCFSLLGSDLDVSRAHLFVDVAVRLDSSQGGCGVPGPGCTKFVRNPISIFCLFDCLSTTTVH